MSNEVYGYAALGDRIQTVDASRLSSLLDTPLGVVLIGKEELYGFSAPYLPTEMDTIFMVTDSPESKNATYLIDFMDYAPEAQIGLPHRGRDRLALLGDLVQALFCKCNASQVVLAVTDSSQIEEKKTVSLDDFLPILIEDSEEMAPPSCQYIVTRAN